MRINSITHLQTPSRSAQVRFAAKPDPDELNLKNLLSTKEPFFTHLTYPFLKTGVTRFDDIATLDRPAFKAVIKQIQTAPDLTAPHHKQLGKLLESAMEQLEKTGMFNVWTSKHWDYRRQRAAQAGQTIAKLAQLPSPSQAGFSDLAQLWGLALASNPRSEMAMFSALWAALSLPPGHKRDLVITLGVQNDHRDVRRLASHGVSTMQDQDLKEAVLWRMSNDPDALIRLRSDVLKKPNNPINWLLSWVILKKPSY